MGKKSRNTDASSQEENLYNEMQRVLAQKKADGKSTKYDKSDLNTLLGRHSYDWYAKLVEDIRTVPIRAVPTKTPKPKSIFAPSAITSDWQEVKQEKELPAENQNTCTIS